MVNFNYVSLPRPKFVPNQKDFIILAASVAYQGFKLSKFLKLFTSDGQTRLKQIQNSSCRQVVYSKIIILPRFLLYGVRLHHLFEIHV